MTRTPRHLHLLLVGLLVLAATSCRRAEDTGPPPLVYGTSVCDLCTMIISDERYAAALVMRDEHHDVIRPAFDDIGCLLGYEADHPDAPIIARYGHDHDTRAWVDLDRATFVHSPELPTPMASGVATFGDAAAASAFLARTPGEALDFPSLRDRFARGALTAGPG